MIVNSQPVHSNLNYFDQQQRRETFKKWVFKENQPCNADKMAEAGFIFTGSLRDPDSAACFFCNKHLDGWEAADDPWKEHLNHAKECDFAKMQVAQDNWTLAQWLDLHYKYQQIVIDKMYQEKRNAVTKMFNKLKRRADIY
ncbi:baculoviral IAP repeat-containing protein 5.1 [Sitophilus oryzae]|uniref:Baculoviral IAP repeat-containing protein 5.1 n=1 Tax=Sitophilus oryzae TaxID=7048 RepID=A0A6J2XD21_SITOR|nr:baculoviral IAP repeat-containing protein 5.1 [Sitophilus oryzae]